MAGDIPDVYLRFDKFTGSCQDVLHPGEEGWIGIRNFTFGFGFPGKGQSATTPTDPTNSDTTKDKSKGKSDPKKPKTTKTPGMTSGPMTFDPVSFTKGSDAMSTQLMNACRHGSKIDTVDLEVCRSGGEKGDTKVPFVQMSFNDVYVKTCKLNLTSEGLPEETVEFAYEKVTMKALWTDNTTGKKLGETIVVSWAMSQGQAENQ